MGCLGEQRTRLGKWVLGTCYCDIGVAMVVLIATLKERGREEGEGERKGRGAKRLIKGGKGTKYGGKGMGMRSRKEGGT